MRTWQTWELRAAFAARMAAMYGREVPAYTTLVEVSTGVNADVVARDGVTAQRLGSIDRVTAERHGAIRVGTPAELAQLARVFAGFGMYPVGFYDLRDASKASVPVVSTAFRPIDSAELARNPFRVFTSMLVTDDRRFFGPDLQARLDTFLAGRTLFSAELLGLADKADADRGLTGEDAETFLKSATAAFELSADPVDRAWYAELAAVSAVAADIGGQGSTHINHLTPRVLDIDELYRRMADRGIEMIDAIQGPPRWDGPPVLLRQTSFRALAEPRRFRAADGSVHTGELRVRFGEVEARGIALTAAGRDRYDAMLVEIDARMSGAELTGRARARLRLEAAAEVWARQLPRTELGLLRDGLGFFSFESTGAPIPEAHLVSGDWSPAELVEAGALRATPIVYEDFLPRSAAGIFQSNLTDQGRKDAARAGTSRDAGWLSDVIGREVADPIGLYAAQQEVSLDAALAR